MMLSDAASEHVIQERPGMRRTGASFASRKIWLPRLVYDCLPYFYLTAGFAAFFATLYIHQWFWVVPHYILFSAACLHLGIRIYGKRRTAARQDLQN